MSAYMVCDTHINALLTTGLHFNMPTLSWFDTDERLADAYQAGEPLGRGEPEWMQQHRRTLTPETADFVGIVLLLENRRSVNFRYNEQEPHGGFSFQRLPGVPDPIVTLGALACYEYQACEHPTWHKNEAYQFCDALRRRLVNKLVQSYDIWEITDPDITITR